MRYCIKCKQYKEETDFNWRNIDKNYLQSVCRDCQKQQGKDRYENHPETVKKINKDSREKARIEAQKFIADYLVHHPCADCGERDPVVLTFDHINGHKKMNVADMVSQGYSIKTIQEEINKCIVLCFNCHMRREYRRRNLI